VDELGYIVDELQKKMQPAQRGIVFFYGKDFAIQVAEKLSLPVITGDSQQSERVEVWSNWRTGSTPVICTNKAGYYGIDYPDVAFTLHVDCPGSMLDFAQSSGRAGRNGEIVLSAILLPRKILQLPKYARDMEETFGGPRAIKELVHSTGCYRIPMARFLDGSADDITCATLAEQYGDKLAWCGNCAPEGKQEGRWDAPLEGKWEDL
jgi:superfamily II DNA helicase RecQ